MKVGVCLVMTLASAMSTLGQDESTTQTTEETNSGPLSAGVADIVHVTEDEVAFAFMQGIRLEFGGFSMRAENAILWSTPRLPGTSEKDPLKAGLTIPPAPGTAVVEALPVEVAGSEPALEQLREVYLEGHVLWQRAPDAVVFADALYYNFVERRGVLRQGGLVVEGTVQRDRETRQYALQVRADQLRLNGLSQITMQDGEFSTCTFGHPHYHVRTGETSIVLDTVSDEQTKFRLSSQGNRLNVGETPVLPLPSFSIEGGTGEGIPLRRVRVDNSSADGTSLRTTWGKGFERPDSSLHRWLGIDQPMVGDFEVQVDFMSKRGPALGPAVTYEAEGRYFGEIGTYFVHDRADEDRTRLDRPQIGGEGDPLRFDIDQPLRGRAFTRNRLFLDDAWRLDGEAHYLSDEGFQREFLEREAKEAKEPESYAHLVYQSGPTRFRTLYRNRLNDFDTQLDSLPRVSFEQVAVPLLPIPDFGLASGGFVLLEHATEVAGLRRHPADDALTSSEFIHRGDTRFELSAPFEVGPVGIRPFSWNRFTAYDETVNEGPSVGRFAGGAGARAQIPFHRDSALHVPSLGIDGLRHIAVVDVGYEHVYTVNRDADEFVQLDATDALAENEQYLVGFRQRFQTWRGSRVETFLEFDLEMPLFPDEDRDNPVRTDAQGRPVGRTTGPLRADIAYRPGFTHPLLAGTVLFSESEWSVQDQRFEVFNAGFASRPAPDWWTRVAYRTLRGRSRVLTAGFDYQITTKWALSILQQYDLREDDHLEQRLAIRRFGHDFLFEMAFRRDEGEDDTSFSLSIRPVLFRTKGRDRELYSPGVQPDLGLNGL